MKDRYINLPVIRNTPKVETLNGVKPKDSTFTLMSPNQCGCVTKEYLDMEHYEHSKVPTTKCSQDKHAKKTQDMTVPFARARAELERSIR